MTTGELQTSFFFGGLVGGHISHFTIRRTHEAISTDLGLDVTGRHGWFMASWVHGMVTMADVHWRILGKQW